MINDEMDAQLSQALRATRAAPPDGWRSRTLDRLAGVRPARGVPRRWLLVSVGAMVLFGLGFAPIPMGKAPGALEKALAQAEQATTVHVTGHAWTSQQENEFETWASNDGFYREDKLEGGEPAYVYLTQGATVLTFYVENGKKYAYEHFDPSVGRADGRPMPDRSYLRGFFESFKRLHEQLGLPSPDLRITERRERTIWGGERDVVEAEFTVKGTSSISGVSYMDGDMVRIRAEIDPTTGRILSMTHDKFEGTWEPRYEAQYVWDVEIPQDVREFKPPKGTTLERNLWWKTRAARTLARSETEHWIVTLHGVDIDRRGDIVLSLSRDFKPESPGGPYWNTAVPVRAEASDNGGGEYEQLNRYGCDSRVTVSYWTTILRHKQGGANRSRATFTIYPYPRGQAKGQSVTFANVPMPPRQNVDDVFATETEVIQY